jgi:hypothetical protein
MTRPDAHTSLQRSRRKEDLLLASTLARGQVVRSFDELAAQADWVADRVVSVRRWLSNPLAWMLGSAAGAIALGATLRQVRVRQVLRWSWLAWRLYGSVNRRAILRSSSDPRCGRTRP